MPVLPAREALSDAQVGCGSGAANDLLLAARPCGARARMRASAGGLERSTGAQRMDADTCEGA